MRNPQSLTRAGAAAIHIDRTGALVASISGPLFHPFPQTAPSAEAYALAQAVDHMGGGGTTVNYDCLAVVHAVMGFPHAARATSKLSADYRHIALSAGYHMLCGVTKVKAHQYPDNLQDQEQRYRAFGSNMADVLAVDACARHPALIDSQQGELGMRLLIARTAVR